MKNNTFKFDKMQVESLIRNDLKLLKKMKNSFLYVFDKLKQADHFLEVESILVKEINLGSMNWLKGKSYDWIAIKYDNVYLIIRKYQSHFTFFTRKAEVDPEFPDVTGFFDRFGAFTFNSNLDLLPDNKNDEYVDNRFIDIDQKLTDLIEAVMNDDIMSLWNNYSFPRPKHCEVNPVFCGETMLSIDKVIFCAEELSNLNNELLAENEVLEALKLMEGQSGMEFDGGKVIGVRTEVKNEYYHSAGIEFKKDGKSSEFKDVYSIVHWYMDSFEKLITAVKFGDLGELKERTIKKENIKPQKNGYFHFVNDEDQLMTSGYKLESKLWGNKDGYRWDYDTVKKMRDRYITFTKNNK